MTNLYSIRPKGFNIGNDAIYIGVNHFIRQVFKGSYNVISLPATGKYEGHRKAGLSSQTIYEVNQFGDGLIIGGGNLYENGELEVNHTALKALEKPMMVFAVSRGRVYNSKKILVDRTDVMTDRDIKAINDKAIVSLSRDHATKAYVDSLGSDNLLGGCPTLFMNEIPQHYVPLMDTDKTDALISIRTPSLMSIPVDYQYNLRDELLEIIEVLKNQGYKNIKFLCHDHRDIPFAASFKDIDYLYTEDIYTYLTYLRNTRLNVTFRLHSFLPCMAFEIPAIKISYDQRAISMMDTIGMDEWNIKMLEVDPVKELEARLKSISDLDAMKNKLRTTVWQDLKDVITSNCMKFAEQVEAAKC